MKVLSFILLFFSTYLSWSQQYHFNKYSIEEGLSRSGVYSILEDHAGFVWVGTEGGGLCKFDGLNFQEYTRHNGLPSENIRVLFEDDRGVLWLGTSHGLSYFIQGEIQTITTDQGLADNFVRSITQDYLGNIWVGTDRGISIIDPDEKGISGELKVNFTLPHKKIRSLIAQDEIVWIGTDRGLCKFEDQKFSVITTEDGLSNDLILSMYVDESNNLWVGTQNGLNKLNPSTNTIESWNEEDGIIHPRIKSITQDINGRIWLGTSSGISILNTDHFVNLTEKNGLSNDRIRCLNRDSFGNIWIGTYFGGIMRYSLNDFVGYTVQEGLASNQILDISELDSNEIVVSTLEGLTALVHTGIGEFQLKEESILNNFQKGAITAVLTFDDEIWLGYGNKLLRIKNQQTTSFGLKEGMMNTVITALEKVENEVWIGTENGVGVYDLTDEKITFYEEKEGLAGQIVSGILPQKGNLVWIAFEDGELSLFHNGRLLNPVVADEVNEINCIAQDNEGHIWLGTNGNGIFHGDYDEVSHEVDFVQLSKMEGLMSDYIYSILVLENEVWVGHENGLDMITPEDSTFIIKSFGPEHGFAGLQNNKNASFIDSQGNLWFGTVNGLFCLNQHSRSHFTSGQASINYLTKIKINGKEIDWKSSEWNDGTYQQFLLPKNLVLPYDQNSISFEFIGINYNAPENVTYRWKLEGFNDNWSVPTNMRFATYTNLPPGKYTFVLQSSDEHGVMVSEELRFMFKIQRPFWKQWWFIVVAALIGVFLIHSFMRWRTRKLIKQKTKLEAVIQDRTKEIQSQADELSIKNKEVTDSILYSKRIQRSILPGKEKVDQILKDYFIFYQPKDIVSGDFYWVEVHPKNPNQVFFAAADCTGHGVPGAMVSLIGTRALTSSLKESSLFRTNEILDNTNEIMIEAFTDSETGKVIKDGMDIALCSLNYDNDLVDFQFSGAQNPAWIVRHVSEGDLVVDSAVIEASHSFEDLRLFEIKGTKQPIGYFEHKIDFELHEAKLKKGDRIYIFTDGYADQFGGEKGKKFKYKSLKQIILEAQELSLPGQKEILFKTYVDWKRDLEQVDDICLIGVEV